MLEEERQVSFFVPIEYLVSSFLDGLLGNFHTFPAEYHTKILDFNFGSAVAWTHLALPSMIRRGSGRIIMCSSLAYLASLNMSS
jgi:short-subunit dehydrogenase